MNYLQSINQSSIPQHVAIIMDGNGRWAKQQGEDRIFGHHEGVNSVREIVEACGEIGVKFLTLYAFSTENWNRPKIEVNALMTLLVRTIKSESKTLMKNGIKLDEQVYRSYSENGKTISFNGKNSHIKIPNNYTYARPLTFYASFYPSDIKCDKDEITDEYAVFAVPGEDLNLSYNSFRTYKF